MKKTLLLLFCLPALSLFSQNVNSARITVFKPGDEGVKTITKKDSLAGHDHNCLKWNYSLLVRGVFLINWEFRIRGNLTAELGLGLTYRDFVFEFTHGGLDGGAGGSSISWGESVGNPGVSFCAEGGIRYYLSGFDNFEGIYVAGTLSYRPYSFPHSSDIALYGGTLVPGYDFLDGQFKIGYQATGYYTDFTYDFYVGVGYRNATLNYYAQSTNPVNGQFIGVPQTTTEGFPQFLMGMKIGYSF